MNIFLHEMSEYLGQRSAYVVMDCAGWHLAKELIIPTNIEIIYLPPYSPELNPVERFWQYVKNNTIKNRVFDDLHQLESVLSNFLKTIPQEIKKSISYINYLST